MLYRQNGSPGAPDNIDDLAEAENERKGTTTKKTDEMRKGRLGLTTSISLLVVEITLRIIGLM